MRSLLVVLCSLCLWSLLGSGVLPLVFVQATRPSALLPGAPPVPPAKVAVVDMNAILDAYKEASQRKKALEEMAEKFQGRLNSLKKEGSEFEKRFNEKKAQRSAFDPAKVEFRELTAEMKRIEVEIDALETEHKMRAQAYEAEIDQQNQQFTLQMYRELREAITKIAERQGINLVVRIDAETKDEKNLRRQLNQAMITQVLYAGKDLDITRSVIDLLNSK